MHTNSNEKMSFYDLIGLTTDIVAAYLSKNEMAVDQIPSVVNTVYQSLNKLSLHGNAVSDRIDPVVPIEESIHDDYIICLEDGKKLKMLKRHLKSAYNMTPEQYRDRWDLPMDYPMVAPNYAKRRSSLAMEIGLGRKRKEKKAA